jgi:beta-glucanase (GH16 family)
MNRRGLLTLLTLFVCLTPPLLQGRTASSRQIETPPPAPKPTAKRFLLDIEEGVEKRVTVSSGQVTANISRNPAASGLKVTVQPGKDETPGIGIKPPDGAPWNLAAYGHLEAQIVNTSLRPITVSLRVGDTGGTTAASSNTESVTLAPGAFGTLTTLFGYSSGYKPGYALKPAAITNVLLFASKSVAAQSFCLTALIAGGVAGEKPPIASDTVRIQPGRGVLLGLSAGSDLLFDARQLEPQGASVSLKQQDGESALEIVFPAAKPDAAVRIKPPIGRWDLRQGLEVRLQMRNEGQTPVTPRVRLDSNGGSTEWTTGDPLPPGRHMTLVVPFARATPVDLSAAQEGTRFTSDACSAVTIAAAPAESVRTLTVDSITFDAPPTEAPLPWLGQRPPVEGAWVKTLDEEFNGPTLDSSLWNVYAENYWDKPSHFSKDNVLLGDGVVKLHYEKKTGVHNDDPKKPPTDYATGYLDTYGKWVQRYGYFEARIKLPTAPGLWPAFWMMPDRGVAAGDQGKRQDTHEHGMEFDIMEFLTRWGPYRYNVAMHYDGYDKEHKSVGSDSLYVQPDRDGFLTCGLLWTPGLAVYYCNGRELLRWENPRISDVPSDLMFTLVSGGWDNDAIDDSRLPADLIVDYVRVWQRQDLASPLDGKRTPPAVPKK